MSSVGEVRLDEARLLLDERSWPPGQSAIVLSFALEEFGKALLLDRALDQQSSDQVTVEGFYDHRRKFGAARAVIPPAEQEVVSRSFGEDFFDSEAFETTGVPADFDTRLSLLYVDFVEGKWRSGFEVEPETVRASINAISVIVGSYRMLWDG